MLRFLTIICFCLLVTGACNQSSQHENSTAKADSASIATNRHPLPDCVGPITKIKDGNSLLIDSVTAFKLYNNYKEKAIKGRRKEFFCPEFRYFKCGRFLKNTIEAHLCINEKSITDFIHDSVYDGIRLYPCRDDKKLKFLIVLIQKVPIGSEGDSIYIDKPKTPIILLVLDKLQDRICAINDNKRTDHTMRPFTSHRLCTPNCPDDDDDLLFDY